MIEMLYHRRAPVEIDVALEMAHAPAVPEGMIT
jgi:hypothetical protein